MIEQLGRYRHRAMKYVKWSIAISILVLIYNIGGLGALFQMFFMGGIMIGQFALIFWFMSKVGAEEIMLPGEINVDFSMVYGQESAVKRVKETKFYLENPDEIESRGGTVPKGVLLWGPPGTGKTLIAKALAGETGLPFVLVGPGAFTSMFFGVNIIKVKRLFKRLRRLSDEYGGVVCFMDEIDNLGNRGGAVDGRGPLDSGSHACDIVEQPSEFVGERVGDRKDNIIMGGMGGGQMGTLEILLSEMDGMGKRRGILYRLRRLFGLPLGDPPTHRILFLAATNLPQKLDPALLRPGRLDRKIKVNYPDRDGRIATYRGYLAKVRNNLTEDDIYTLADNNPYATGASIKDAVNEALILALQDGREEVTWTDIRDAIIWKQMGDEEGRQTNDEDQWRVAVHEAAHAVAAHHFRSAHRIQFASVVRRGQTLGVVSSVPLGERFTRTQSEFESDIKVSLASHWAEDFFFGDISSGPSHDLLNATRVAQNLLGRFGLGKGLAVRAVSPQTGELAVPTEEVNKYLKKIYKDMAEFLRDRRDQIEMVAQLLDQNDTVDGEDIHALLERMEG